MSVNSLGAKGTLAVGGTEYEIYRLAAVEGLEKLPYSLKVLAEALLRTEDGADITAEHVQALAHWDPNAEPDTEIQFTPARVVMQDFTGVPVRRGPRDHARGRRRARRRPRRHQPARARRDGHRPLGADRRVRPRRRARRINTDMEYERNRERYQFLRWGQTRVRQLPVVPPGTGIVHQVNLEYLARGVMTRRGRRRCRLRRTRTRAWARTATPR